MSGKQPDLGDRYRRSDVARARKRLDVSRDNVEVLGRGQETRYAVRAFERPTAAPKAAGVEE